MIFCLSKWVVVQKVSGALTVPEVWSAIALSMCGCASRHLAINAQG